MIDKTLTGVPFFDDRFGGTYRHRPMVISGRAGTGKTVFAIQFVMQGLQQDERCLLLSAWRANDLVIFAESLGFPLTPAIDNGRLIVLEYNQYIGREKEWNHTLPPEGFLQLEDLIKTQAVQRVVLDTALPWVCISDHHRLDEHLFSFVRAFDRMRVTTVMTLPKPVSPMAFRVKNTLDSLVPVSVTLVREPAATAPLWVVGKYLGESRIAGGTPYRIVEGRGIQAAFGASLELAPDPASEPSPVQAARPEPARPAEPGKPIRFSSIMPGLDKVTPIPERRHINRPF